MHVVIGGYGRVGKYLAHMLEQRGHTVAVIDRNEAAFEEIGDIAGQKIVGVVFDRATLVVAGIERAGCYAAVTAGDNSNVVSARIAKEEFGVPSVLARIYDPRRAELYREFDIRTVSSVEWACARMLRMIADPEVASEYQFGGGEVEMFEVAVPARLAGVRVREVEVPGEIRVTAMVRDHKAFVPGTGDDFQPGDRVYATVAGTAVERFRTFMGIEAMNS